MSAVPNFSNPNSMSVDQIREDIEVTLAPTFTSMGGTWLVSTTSYHRVSGYVDDRANGMETFCAVNDVNHNLYIVVMKIDK
uniref:Uncharacterized protein n=1 Tax=Caenorhabditis japonica TaxID=281687 RepID=A0A8R1EE03_CAEJA